MTDLKIILNNTNNPDKPSEISIGETRLAGRFFNHDLGPNATVRVRNADIKSDGLKRKKSSRDHDELDYVSGNILIEVVKNYLNNQLSMNNQDGKYILNDQNERHIEFFKTLHGIISSKEFLDGLKDNHTKLRDIFKEVEGKNPDHKDLATDIMKQAIREAAIAGLAEKPFNLSKFLTEKSQNGQNLHWPENFIKKADGFLAKVKSWFKNIFRRLFNTGLGRDTYLKCSLVDDQIASGEASKEAGDLLKEFYIDSVNKNLSLDKFLEGKDVREDVRADITLINNHVNTAMNQPSSAAYKAADSEISTRYETYQDIAKQLSEQKFYQDLSKAADNPANIKVSDSELDTKKIETESNTNINTNKNTNEVHNKVNPFFKSINKLGKQPSEITSQRVEIKTGLDTIKEVESNIEEEESSNNISTNQNTNDLQKKVNPFFKPSNKLGEQSSKTTSKRVEVKTGLDTIKEVESNIGAEESSNNNNTINVSKDKELSNLLKFITDNTNQVEEYKYGYIYHKEADLNGHGLVRLPRCILDAYKSHGGNWDVVQTVTQLENDIAKPENIVSKLSALMTDANKEYNGAKSFFSYGGYNTQSLQSDLKSALSDVNKLNNVLNYGSIETQVQKHDTSNLAFKLASENQVTIESDKSA
ncbi:hypothetical protein [Cysteiniphilum halobium]|uniref:hypothetical protein n=1 Tax=Cysteiniphilum halobium TaxID=2219059 RepID=UPI003F86EA67